ncbi:MAG: M42 family metallopeptidase [Clostridia bacterium]|nr:M42 family metallopeptidase [Clostridia bacterium]
MDYNYAKYATQQTVELLAIDSPTGFTHNAIQWTQRQFEQLGYTTKQTNKGGLMVELGGQGNPVMLTAHVDTLGGMVCQILGNGRLRVTPLGGMNANNAEAENVKVYTRNGKVIEGTFQLHNPSSHVNLNYSTTQRTFDTCEVVLDEDVKSASDVRALGIDVGDVVCFDPRTRITESGYIKSRFLDDKLSVGILLAFAKYLKDNNLAPNRKCYVHVTVFEEVGHGCSASCPSDVVEILSLDMGCIGDGLQCDEKAVSICAKDSRGPYNYDVVTALVNSAKAQNARYALDVYPKYGSDADAALSAGVDAKHGLIGAGVFASHGYERSHLEGVHNTLKLLCGYLAN